MTPATGRNGEEEKELRNMLLHFSPFERHLCCQEIWILVPDQLYHLTVQGLNYSVCMCVCVCVCVSVCLSVSRRLGLREKGLIG